MTVPPLHDQDSICTYIHRWHHALQCMQEARYMHVNLQHKQHCYNLCWSILCLRTLSCVPSFMLAALPCPMHPRSLLLLQGYQTHEVVQLHYLAWPDYGVPNEVLPIFNFIDRMKMLRAPEHGPTVVHCRWELGSNLVQQSFFPAFFFLHLHCFIFSAMYTFVKTSAYEILCFMGIFL